jgi:hypothetical protein
VAPSGCAVRLPATVLPRAPISHARHLPLTPSPGRGRRSISTSTCALSSRVKPHAGRCRVRMASGRSTLCKPSCVIAHHAAQPATYDVPLVHAIDACGGPRSAALLPYYGYKLVRLVSDYNILALGREIVRAGGGGTRPGGLTPPLLEQARANDRGGGHMLASTSTNRRYEYAKKM